MVNLKSSFYQETVDQIKKEEEKTKFLGTDIPNIGLEYEPICIFISVQQTKF